MMDSWDIKPFDPELDDPLPQAVIDRIRAEEAAKGTFWHPFAPLDTNDPAIEQTIQALLDDQCIVAPEMIVPPQAEETYRFALRRLAAMADNKAALTSMRTELYWAYRCGKKAGYKTGEIKEHCAEILAKWRDHQPPREAIQ